MEVSYTIHADGVTKRREYLTMADVFGLKLNADGNIVITVNPFSGGG